MAGIVTDYVQGTLEATRSIGKQIRIISDADCSGAHGTKLEAKVGVVQVEKTGVYVNVNALYRGNTFNIFWVKLQMSAKRMDTFSCLSTNSSLKALLSSIVLVL